MNPPEHQDYSYPSHQDLFSHTSQPQQRKRWQFWRRKPDSPPEMLPAVPLADAIDKPPAPHSLSLANAATTADHAPEVQNTSMTSLPMRDGKPVRPWELRMADHLRQPRWAYTLVLLLVVVALVAITTSTAMIMNHRPNNAGSQHPSSPNGNVQTTETPALFTSEETPTGHAHTPTPPGATPGTLPQGTAPPGTAPSPVAGTTATPVPPRPTATSTPRPACSAPGSWPSTKSWINIFTTAIGRSGTNNICSQVGKSYTTTNPQYVWCRRWGGEVSDSSGNYNHWWLWTDLDTGGRGWISAYYIKDQGNDQANDIYTGRAIPSC